jgi:hypothetical protein
VSKEDTADQVRKIPLLMGGCQFRFDLRISLDIYVLKGARSGHTQSKRQKGILKLERVELSRLRKI